MNFLPQALRTYGKELLRLAWPLIIANSFWNLQLTIDRILLGQLSTEALAAAMAVMGVFWTPMALLQQTAAYLTTFVAHYYGAEQKPMIGASFWQAVYLSVGGGLLFLALIPLGAPLFSLMGHSPAVQELEILYFEALCWSALPTALVAVASAYFSGLGETRPVLWINGSGLVANSLLAYLLIFGHAGFPALGMAGAAYATSLASGVSALVGLWLLFRHRMARELQLWEQWRWHGDLMRRYLRFGLPSGLQWALEGLAFTVFLLIVGRMPEGDAALASSSILVTVMMIAVLPAMGVAQAVTIGLGQELGRRNPDKAELHTLAGFQLCLLYVLLVGSSFLCFPEFYLSWFQKDAEAQIWQSIANMVPVLMRFLTLLVVCDSFTLVFSFALKGAGDTRFVSAVALLLPWPFMVLPTWLMQARVDGIYWAWGWVVLYALIQASIFFTRFRLGHWKRESLIVAQDGGIGLS